MQDFPYSTELLGVSGLNNQKGKIIILIFPNLPFKSIFFPSQINKYNTREKKWEG